MLHRINKELPVFLRQPLSLATALRTSFRHGYSRKDLLHDLGAGLVVGIVAIPLSMALAIASGAPPQHGLYTAIVAGLLTPLLGGSSVQVTGPTAAFVVILAPITAQHGLGGLMLASLMAGLILYCFGLARLGRLIEFVPYPVTTGFTAGIAVVIATLQLKDLLGLEILAMPDDFLEKLAAMIRALPTANGPDIAVAAATLGLLVVWPRLFGKIPGPLVILPLVTLVTALYAHAHPDLALATINNKFSFVLSGEVFPGIPSLPPPFRLPWEWGGADGMLVISLALIRDLFPSAMTIALLAAIESLLSAVIADGMTGQKHHPDAELMALGLGTVAATFLGGFAATGAIARTAANIRFGGRSPIAAAVHALVILAAVVLFAPLLGYLPIAALAALLLLVAWNMSEARHFFHVVRIAPKSDVFVLLACFTLTIVFDMVVAVMTGMVLASVLFIRRMAEVSSVKLVSTDTVDYPAKIRPGVLIYEIAGPLFFGAAEKAMSSMHVVTGEVHTVLLDFRRIPAMDVTGLINLDSAIQKLHHKNITAVLAGVGGQPAEVLRKAGWVNAPGKLLLFGDFDQALEEYALCPGKEGTLTDAHSALQP